jgi:hypothetical protein
MGGKAHLFRPHDSFEYLKFGADDGVRAWVEGEDVIPRIRLPIDFVMLRPPRIQRLAAIICPTHRFLLWNLPRIFPVFLCSAPP